MTRNYILLLFIFIVSIPQAKAQGEYIFSKEGKPELNRRQAIADCVKSLHKSPTDKTILDICECQINLLDRHFTSKEFRQHKKNGFIDITGLIKSDSLFEKEINECFTGTGQTVLITAENFGDKFISNCMKVIQKNTQKKLDSNRVKQFCSCQLDFVKTKKISDEEMQELGNSNSILFYQIMYSCGDPFLNDTLIRNWNDEIKKDINGPSADTLKILSYNGMTFVKIKTGSILQVWMLDSGASDMVINHKMETKLKEEKIIKEEDYLGIGEYEMANGQIDSCRKYKLNNIRIGKYSINNVVVAVSDKSNIILVGKSLLNKFTSWIIDNKENLLILNK